MNYELLETIYVYNFVIGRIQPAFVVNTSPEGVEVIAGDDYSAHWLLVTQEDIRTQYDYIAQLALEVVA